MTSPTTIDEVVLFSELAGPGRRRFGVATLNAPRALNALSLEIVRALADRLARWAADDGIAGVALDATGDRAFCAGGDLRRVAAAMPPADQVGGDGRNPYAEAFFSEEYALDHLLHRYPKPLLVWGHGIVMGGGVGLMAGASHRVVTESTKLAMPEIGIGLYPDVGGSWFLPRLPGRSGLFCALTAAPLNAADALQLQLADVFVPQAHKPAVWAAIASANWSGDAAADRLALTALLAQAAGGAQAPAGAVSRHAGVMDGLVAGDDLLVIAERFQRLASDDPWLQSARAAFLAGSPTSAALTMALWTRAAGQSLGEVFRLEYRATLGCCAHADLREGIRAVLIDKDRHPRWRPATIAQVDEAHIQDHFRPRGPVPACLALLD